MPKIIDIKYVFGVPEALVEIANRHHSSFHTNVKISISLEKHILKMINEDWEVYGEAKSSSKSEEPYIYMQTMVKYQKKVLCEHCGKEFVSSDLMVSDHIITIGDSTVKVCPNTQLL